MRNKTTLEYIIIALIIQITIQGCFGGDKVIIPLKVEGVLNTFEFSEKNWDGKVNFIKVFDSTYSTTLWHIKAIREIQTKNFYVKIGEVPDGFEQVLPSDDTPFLPVQGKKYLLVIDADFSPHVWTGEISWIAK